MRNDITIFIKDQTGGEQKITGGGGSNTNNEKVNNPSANENKKHTMLATIATMTAMRSISYVSSNIGKWTGNSQYQAAVDVVQRGLGYGAAFAANVWVGLATVALDAGTNALDYMYEKHWQDIQTRQAEARAGGKGGYRR